MIPLKTNDQLVELAARAVYLISNLRNWQRDTESKIPLATLYRDKDTEKWEVRCDEFLKDIEATEFNSLKQLISELTITPKKE